jgi:hypothetical protein
MAIAWVNGRPYLRRSVRRGGIVTSQYLGSGEAARLLAFLHAERRQGAEEGTRRGRASDAAEAAGLDAAAAAVAGVADAARSAAHEFLAAVGFHRHDRGAWRRRRMDNEVRKTVITVPEPGPGETLRIPDMAAALVVIHQLTDAADRRARCLDELRSYVAALEGPSPSAIERTLCQSAGLCWLELRILETKPRLDDRRRGRALRRYLDTLRTLATVRRLAVPSSRVSIAAHQINAGVSMTALVAGLSGTAPAAPRSAPSEGGKEPAALPTS